MTIVSVRITGRSAYVLASALLAFSFSVTGCANPVNGTKQGAMADAQQAATAADQAAAKSKKEDAQVALAKRHPDYAVNNELTVSGGK